MSRNSAARPWERCCAASCYAPGPRANTPSVGRCERSAAPNRPLLCGAAATCKARERYADNRIEGRPVAMPANASTRRIFGHHELFKRLCRHSADLVCDLGQGAEVVRDAGIGAGLLPCEDIAMAKAVDTAIAQVAVELEWFEGQLFELPYKGIFLRRRKNIREVMESIRQFRLTEEIG